MRGVVLAGGRGSRLYPLTTVTNKHLVSVGNLPMIEFPLHTLHKIGVDGLNIVTGGEHFSDISRYLMETHPEMAISYHPQLKTGGIAQALSLVKQFVGKRKIAVILGDNIFEDDLSETAEQFEKLDNGAMLFLKQVEDPKRFGVAEIKDGKIIKIEEKPKNPKSDLAVTGLYFYDSSVFDKIKTLKPSQRGEYEITDVNNLYLQEGRLCYHIITGFWSDAGTIRSRNTSNNFVRKGLEQKVLKSISKNPAIAQKLMESFGNF